MSDSTLPLQRFESLSSGPARASLVVLSALLWTVLSIVAGSASGEPTPPDDVVVVRPSPDPIEIRIDSLLANDSSFTADLVLARDPSWGQLEKVSEGLLEYTPSAEFWRHGLDSLMYRGLNPSGTAHSEGRTVLLVASRYGRFHYQSSFEDQLDQWETQDSAGLFLPCQEAAVSGGTGLCLEQPLGSTEGEIRPRIISELSGNGDTQTGGGTIMCVPVCRPPGQGPDPLKSAPKESLLKSGIGGNSLATGMKLFTVGKDPAVEVRIRQQEDDYEVAASILNYSTVWVPLPAEQAAVDVFVSWSPLGLNPPEAGEAALLVDGMPVGFLDASPSANGFSLNVEGGAYLPASFDDSEIWLVASDSGLTPPGELEPPRRMVDDFESGLESGWDESGSAGIGMEVGSPISGIASLLLDVGFGGTGTGLEASWPVAERSFGLTFTADFDDLAMASDDMLLVAALSADAVLNQLHHVRLWIRRENAVTYASLEVLNDTSSAWTEWVPLGSGPRHLLMAWEVDRGPNDDGAAELWLDGQLVGALEGLDTEGLVVDAYRVGAFQIPLTTSGQMKIDDVAAWARKR